MDFKVRLKQSLEKQEQRGLLRHRQLISQNHDGVLSTTKGHYLDFASNDYLGLRNHPDVLQAWVEGLARYGSGSGASSLVTGYMEPHYALEKQIAGDLKRESALLFSSGFAANQALCKALFAQGGTLLCDKYMHASFIEGAVSSHAQFKRFKHNDVLHLQSLLEKKDNTQPVLIATEGVFSMDGDSPDIPAMVSLAQQHNAWFMLDEAHSLGVVDEASGLGTVAHYQLGEQQAPVVMGTFGKALGTSGAFIAGSKILIDYLVNFARDYIYTTAMPPAQAHATLTAWHIMQQHAIRAPLYDNIAYFKQRASLANIALQPSQSAIQWIKIGDPHRTIKIAARLKNLGIWIGAIRTPTVPKGTDRLRITVRADHSHQDIDAFIDAINLVLSSKEERV
jgi:8-amino-7-oxononanoate synthase